MIVRPLRCQQTTEVTGGGVALVLDGAISLHADLRVLRARGLGSSLRQVYLKSPMGLPNWPRHQRRGIDGSGMCTME